MLRECFVSVLIDRLRLIVCVLHFNNQPHSAGSHADKVGCYPILGLVALVICGFLSFGAVDFRHATESGFIHLL
jgi:hypothetical protein